MSNPEQAPQTPPFYLSFTPSSAPASYDLGSRSTSLTLSGLASSVYGGDNGIQLSGGGGLSSVSLGNGNDSVLLGGALNTVVLGDGNNAVDAGSGQATVCIGANALQLSYDNALFASLDVTVPVPNGQPVAPPQWSDWGWFNCGTGNVGLFNGLLDSAASSGNDNTGALNGIGNGAAQDGNGNIGVLNGVVNGTGNSDATSGTNDGNGNVGVLNGAMNGNLNTGAQNGTDNGSYNLGVLNGTLNGNLNTGPDNGSQNGNDNLGSANGSVNGNGQPPGAAPAPLPSGTPTLTGGLDTIVVGNGDNQIKATAGLSTVQAGNGCNQVTLGGSYDVVVAGNGANCITGTVDHAAISLGSGSNTVTLSGSGSDLIQTGCGNDVIRLSGTDNWVDAGGASGMNIIYGSSGGDTFVIDQACHGYDQIFNFSLGNGDQLDLSKALCAAGWDGSMSNLDCYLHASSDGANTWIAVAGTCGVSSPVAELMGVKTTLPQLLAHQSLVLQG